MPDTRYRIALFLAALALIFIAECVRLGRLIGSHYAEWQRAVYR